MIDHRQGDICQLPATNICQLPLPSNVGREASTSPAAHRSVLPRPSRLIIIATILIIPASKARKVNDDRQYCPCTVDYLNLQHRGIFSFMKLVSSQRCSIKSFGDEFQNAVFKHIADSFPLVYLCHNDLSPINPQPTNCQSKVQNEKYWPQNFAPWSNPFILSMVLLLIKSHNPWF